MSEVDFNFVVQWWHALKSDRGGMAELRRAHNPSEVVFVPAYHRLCSAINAQGFDKEALACVAGLCAHVKESSNSTLADQMKPVVSSLRFRRVLAINDRTEFYHAMIRVIRLLKKTVNVRDLAKIVYLWNEETRKELAYNYYAE